MSWSTTNLSTIASITRHETEVSDLITGGADSYMATALDIATDTDPIATGVSGLYVGNAQGVIEIDVIAASKIIIADGEELTIKFYDSIDDDAYEEIHAGAVVYSRVASGAEIIIAAGAVLAKWVVPPDADDYVKPVITSSASNSGTISVYSVSTWDDKIDVAKEYLGNRLRVMLTNRGVVVDEAGGDDLLDLIVDPATLFGLASDYLTLYYIYRDLDWTHGNTRFSLKAENYKKEYYIEYDLALKGMKFDTDGDGTADTARANIQPRFV